MGILQKKGGQKVENNMPYEEQTNPELMKNSKFNKIPQIAKENIIYGADELKDVNSAEKVAENLINIKEK